MAQERKTDSPICDTAPGCSLHSSRGFHSEALALAGRGSVFRSQGRLPQAQGEKEAALAGDISLTTRSSGTAALLRLEGAHSLPNDAPLVR